MNTFITSDYHFSHENIIKYCNRPFKNINDMNTQIIKNHNERVKDDDTIYFLGDFGFFASENREFRGEGKPYQPSDFLNKMKGTYWYFLRGNHDKRSNKFYPKAETIIINQNGLRIQLIHDPIYAKIEYDFILCGHVHNNWKAKELQYCGQTKLILNVCVDVWNFYPVKLDELLTIYYKWQKEREKLQRWEHSKFVQELNKNTLLDAKEQYEK
jgi:calcineurin-like phosphoesterase family protein